MIAADPSMSPGDIVLVSGVAIAGAVTLAWRALYLLGRGEAPPPLNGDHEPDARQVQADFNRRRLTDEQRRAVQEAQARLYKPH